MNGKAKWFQLTAVRLEPVEGQKADLGNSPCRPDTGSSFDWKLEKEAESLLKGLAE